jgi:TonB-like protein
MDLNKEKERTGNEHKEGSMKGPGSIGQVVMGAIFFCSILLLGAQAQSQQPNPDWSKKIRTLEEFLQQSKWEEAREQGQYLSEALAEHGGGTIADHRAHADELNGAVFGADPVPEGLLLGRVTALRAIAEAELGRFDEACWHWYAAQNLSPGDVRAIDLSQYGTAGEFLRHQMLTDAQSEHAGLVDVIDPVRPEGSYSRNFQQPVRTKVVYPRRPQDLSRRDRFSKVVNIQITVDESGQIRQPLVIDGGFYPGLIYRAFEALRRWQYQPATFNGKPVAFRYVVPVVFADDRPERPGTSF